MADAYVLGHLIHDYDDARVKILLQRVYKALNEGTIC